VFFFAAVSLQMKGHVPDRTKSEIARWFLKGKKLVIFYYACLWAHGDESILSRFAGRPVRGIIACAEVSHAATRASSPFHRNTPAEAQEIGAHRRRRLPPRLFAPSTAWEVPSRSTPAKRLDELTRAAGGSAKPSRTLLLRGWTARRLCPAIHYLLFAFLYVRAPLLMNLMAFAGPPVPVILNLFPRCLLRDTKNSST
jgi:hypothetical protein